MTTPARTRVVHLAPHENSIDAGDERYLVARDPTGVCYTINDKCPHRGGPLNLGTVDGTARFVVCPWHTTRTSMAYLVARALPTVRAGDRVSVVVPSGAATPRGRRRTVLLECRGAIAEAVARRAGHTT
jgi:Rieske [2Fe-2S] domain